MLNAAGSATLTVGEEDIYLLPDRAVWRPKHQQLIIADLHIGKSAHFRKNGLPAVQHFLDQDLARLGHLIEQYPVKELIVLGDLFHSTANEEHAVFFDWIAAYPQTQWFVTLGNHDLHSFNAGVILPSNLSVSTALVHGGMRFSHINEAGDGFLFHGHEHPVYTLKGRGGLKYTGPCFVLRASEKRCILPAFGSMTGGARISKLHASDKIYLIAERQVIPC